VLHLLDQSLEAFLRAEVPLSARQVEVAFDAPDDDWRARVAKPTVNLFLWDVRQNLKERHAGMTIGEDQDGKRFRAPPKPRVDFRYLVTAWTTEVRDEHQLLGAVLATLLLHPDLPEAYLQGAFAPVRPIPTLTAAQPDGEESTDFWSALGGRLKPGLDLVVTATVDAAAAVEAGPPVERYEIGTAFRREKKRVSQTRAVGGRVEDEGAKGAIVRSPRGSSKVGPDGRFLVRAEEGDEVVVETDEPWTGRVERDGALRLKPRARRTKG
jgi:Pvc16 N-terminal domain